LCKPALHATFRVSPYGGIIIKIYQGVAIRVPVIDLWHIYCINSVKPNLMEKQGMEPGMKEVPIPDPQAKGLIARARSEKRAGSL
jgi:hypothetical protein